MPVPGASTVGETVDRLRNVHDGEQAIPDVVAWGEIAVPPLESLLRGPSEAVPHSRCWAADALAGIGSLSAIHALLRALHDSGNRSLQPALSEVESVVLARIAEHLSKVPGAAVSDALLEALRAHPASPACVQAAGIRRDPRSLTLLAGCLFEDASRQAAEQVLRAFEESAVPHLLQAAVRPSGSGPEAPTHIEGRRAATQLLGEWLVRHVGVRSPASDRIAAALGEQLRDPEERVRLAAAISLSHLPAMQTPIIAGILVSGLAHVAWSEVDTIMVAIERLGPLAWTPLSEVIGDDSAAALQRLRAVQISGRMRQPGVAALLGSLAQAADAGLRLEAVRALGRLSSADPSVLARFLEDTIAPVRRTAIAALWRHHALAIEQLVAILADPDRYIRRLARAVMRRDRRASLPLLLQAIRLAGHPAHGLGRRWRLCREASMLAMRFCLTRRDARGSVR